MSAMDPPTGLIAVPLGKGGVLLLLTEREYLAGIRRGKLWRRAQAASARALDVPLLSVDPIPVGNSGA
jgi:hypothetical protein